MKPDTTSNQDPQVTQTSETPAAPAPKPRFGGRQPGSLNRVTALTKNVIAGLLGEYQQSGLMSRDFQRLSPKDRLLVAEKLMQYVLPRMQVAAIDLSDASSPNRVSLTQRLLALSRSHSEPTSPEYATPEPSDPASNPS